MDALDSALSRVKTQTGSGLQLGETYQPQALSSTRSSKRKLGNEDLGDSVEDGSAIQPSECKKSKMSAEASQKFRHPAALVPGGASPARPESEPVHDASTAPMADAMYGVRHEGDVRADSDEVKDSQASQHASFSQNAEQPPQPAPFDTDQRARDFDSFYHTIRRAVEQVNASIGNINNFPCALDELPSERLEALYARCFGSEWEAVRVKLMQDYVFTVPDVTMAVVSAFLFDNVLNQHASTQDIRAKQLELSGATGRAILRTLDLDSGEHELMKVVRIIESEDARITLAEGEKSGNLEQQLHAEAQKFVEQLWDVVVPHFRSLSTLARCLGLSAHRPSKLGAKFSRQASPSPSK